MKNAPLTFAIAFFALTQPSLAAGNVVNHSVENVTSRILDPYLVFGAKPPESATYQSNTSHTGSIAASLKAPLAVKWAVNLGGSVGYPVVANGIVVVAANGALVALSAKSGKMLWTQPAPTGGGWVGPAYDNGAVFSNVLYTNGSEGIGMYAFDQKTGHQMWDVVIPGQYAFSSPPTARKGVVYTGGAGTGGTVYAYAESNGHLNWTASVENGDNSSPVVTANGLYVSYACPQTYEFNPQNGASIWHYSGPCEGGGGSTAVLYDKLLFVEDSFAVSGFNGIALTASNGQPAANFNPVFTPAFANHIGYFTPNAQTMLAATTPTVSQAWMQTPKPDTYATPPLVIGSTVYIETVSGELLGYSAKTGALQVSMGLGFGDTSPGFSAGLAFGSNLLFVPAGSELIAVQGS